MESVYRQSRMDVEGLIFLTLYILEKRLAGRFVVRLRRRLRKIIGPKVSPGHDFAALAQRLNFSFLRNRIENSFKTAAVTPHGCQVITVFSAISEIDTSLSVDCPFGETELRQQFRHIPRMTVPFALSNSYLGGLA